MRALPQPVEKDPKYWPTSKIAQQSKACIVTVQDATQNQPCQSKSTVHTLYQLPKM